MGNSRTENVATTRCEPNLRNLDVTQVGLGIVRGFLISVASTMPETLFFLARLAWF